MSLFCRIFIGFAVYNFGSSNPSLYLKCSESFRLKIRPGTLVFLNSSTKMLLFRARLMLPNLASFNSDLEKHLPVLTNATPYPTSNNSTICPYEETAPSV
jgi:hypothetical protein